ncbi:beta-ketoacyl synthase chain length factor [Hydrogenophaga sp. PAMC20947]|uniref:beta-ketoacyl synthase chain length factor n=1 Tax=Hydrogenophaga sp. PAMC20947 TaxID=2565558 RepID=UPI00109DBEDC|nr:beta-ketoacyl synthase chain length factor [Hydrogenophaga sp. PAMC20947]QCB45001.1 3-oxoacyl-ACP synthase [Hydrogenophaga sp. PAMC20947]
MSTVTHAPLRAWIQGIGLIAPGMPDWPTARAVLAGEQAYVPAPSVLPVPSLLPTAERRRASRVIKLSLGLGLEAVAHAGADASTLATVFSASGADGHNCHALCEQLASDDRQVSPTRFHNSVHNAAAGYWGIATRCMAPCQVIGAFDASLGAGLLDAMAQVVCTNEPVLLVAYDSEYPQPLFAKRDTPDCAGVALLLTPQPSGQSLASIALRTTRAAAATLQDPGLEQLRQKVPALRSLPLLQRLAQRLAGPVVLDYLAPQQIELDVQPC